MAVSKRFLELVKEIEVLHDKKNAGYAGESADPFNNFKFSTLFGVSAFVGCLVRMADKFMRISNLSKNLKADQVGETVKDTLLDLSVYCLIAICLYEEEQEAKIETKEDTFFNVRNGAIIVKNV